jgi:DNA (cytosine-5)-methyltransferase 1
MLNANDIVRDKGWIYQKGAKSEEGKGTDRFTYNYAEGPMKFPDPLDSPSRTIITGEGGLGASRFKHVVVFKPTKKQKEEFNLNSEQCVEIQKQLSLKKGEWVRRLVPIELERLNMFSDNHTEGASDSKRAFLMGNALVIGVIERIANQLV